MKNLQEQLNHISSYTSKLLRKKFGRGPESCSATLSKHYLLLHIRGFISPMEEVLLQQGKSYDVDHARTLIIANVLDELKGVVQISFGVDVKEYYHDWNFPNNTGIILLVFEENVAGYEDQFTFDNIKKFEEEVARISALVQKVPNSIETIPLSETVFLVERKGILIAIEKALISKGFEKQLIATKDELEKDYFHRYSKFNEILSREIQDIFIDWDLHDDKSIMIFKLK
ncbi:hypothetical protein JCM9140_2136 [Halalkalibacter wakoensis JCM 9140]|uniref:Na+-translocating membrane potential-generating system MpsC domain-containing protein n=1 Tax=Halalkalibacter wakoensis JCM 9140 TaxID=1236970 RepID=W4Q311_9BACI|nr:Na-translocating system protein MpsC family protein [Halalkalibacter wakoensis]GAE26108.1 hypothetical protein JCM9140_2136 [Halalkalibacter wakoensis JCM 9140]